MRNLLSILLFLGAGACVVLAFQAIGQSNEERSALSDAALSSESYLKWQRVGWEYGQYASNYWRVVVHENDPHRWEAVHIRIARTFGTTDDMRKQVEKAVAAGFQTQQNEKLDREIMINYAQMQKCVPEALRRQVLSERFKDMMAFIGGAAVFGIAWWSLVTGLGKEPIFRRSTRESAEKKW